MIYKDEIKPAMSNDLRISGWGVWFSGILIISIVILIIYLKKYREESYILISLGTTLLLLIIMSESWWARYTPHFYLFVILALYVLLKYNNKKIINYIVIFLISVNTLIPLLGNGYYTLKNSFKIRNDLNKLSNKTIIINEDNVYNGVFYNLKDFNIKYEFGEVKENKLYYNYLDYQVK